MLPAKWGGPQPNWITCFILCFPCGTYITCVLQQDNRIFIRECTILLLSLNTFVKIDNETRNRRCDCACHHTIFWIATGATPSYFRLPRLLISWRFIYPTISDSSNQLEFTIGWWIGYYIKITHSIGLAILWSMIILYIVTIAGQVDLGGAHVYLFSSARTSQDILI